jgi:hypothetical protein
VGDMHHQAKNYTQNSTRIALKGTTFTGCHPRFPSNTPESPK